MVDGAVAQMDVFEVVKIALQIFRVVVPVVDAPALGKALRRLQLARPDRGFARARAIQRRKRQHRMSVRVVPASNRIGPAIPARIHAVIGRITVCGVRKYRPGVVQNHIQNHVDAVRMGSGDQLAQVFAAAETRLDVEKILRRVAVIGFGVARLLEYRTDPQRGHAEAFQIADLGGCARERAANKACARFAPVGGLLVIAERVGVIDRGEHRRATARRERAVVVAIALFAPIRKSVDQQKIKHLVFPRIRRRMESPLGQRVEIDIVNALHGRTTAAPREAGYRPSNPA